MTYTCVITRQSSVVNSVDKYWRTVEWKICVCIPENEQASGISCLNRINNQSVGTGCHPAVGDMVCPALVSVPDGSSEFKVLPNKGLLLYLVFTV